MESPKIADPVESNIKNNANCSSISVVVNDVNIDSKQFGKQTDIIINDKVKETEVDSEFVVAVAMDVSSPKEDISSTLSTSFIRDDEDTNPTPAGFFFNVNNCDENESDSEEEKVHCDNHREDMSNDTDTHSHSAEWKQDAPNKNSDQTKVENMQEYRSTMPLVCYSETESELEESSSESETDTPILSESSFDDYNENDIDDSADDTDIEDNDAKENKKEHPEASWKTDGELFPQELPPLDYLTISVGEDVDLEPLGTVSGIVDVLVIIKSVEASTALFDDTVLFTENRKPLGLIFETLGTVGQPFYSVRFNSNHDIVKRNINIGDRVMYAPKASNLTKFVFIAELKRMTACDASWENDNEPPFEELHYSDDEEEQKAIKKIRHMKYWEEILRRRAERRAQRRARREQLSNGGEKSSKPSNEEDESSKPSNEEDESSKPLNKEDESSKPSNEGGENRKQSNEGGENRKPANEEEIMKKRKRRSLKKKNESGVHKVQPSTNKSGLPQGSMNRNPFGNTSFTAHNGYKALAGRKTRFATKRPITKYTQVHSSTNATTTTMNTSNITSNASCWNASSSSSTSFGANPNWKEQPGLMGPRPDTAKNTVNPFSIIAPPSFLPPPSPSFCSATPPPPQQPVTANAIGMMQGGVGAFTRPPPPPSPSPTPNPGLFSIPSAFGSASTSTAMFDFNRPPPPPSPSAIPTAGHFSLFGSASTATFDSTRPPPSHSPSPSPSPSQTPTPTAGHFSLHNPFGSATTATFNSIRLPPSPSPTPTSGLFSLPNPFGSVTAAYNSTSTPPPFPVGMFRAPTPPPSNIPAPPLSLSGPPPVISTISGPPPRLFASFNFPPPPT